jgi:hypothetical protein
MENHLVELMGMLTGAIISLGFFTAVFFAIYFSVKARNKERMMLIERGLDISEIYRKKNTGTGFGFFKFGVVAIGIGIGLFAGWIFNRRFDSGVGFFVGILVFGGVGVLIANFLVEKLNQK